MSQAAFAHRKTSEHKEWLKNYKAAEAHTSPADVSLSQAQEVQVYRHQRQKYSNIIHRCPGWKYTCGRLSISRSGISSSGIPSPEVKIFKHYSSPPRMTWMNQHVMRRVGSRGSPLSMMLPLLQS